MATGAGGWRRSAFVLYLLLLHALLIYLIGERIAQRYVSFDRLSSARVDDPTAPAPDHTPEIEATPEPTQYVEMTPLPVETGQTAGAAGAGTLIVPVTGVSKDKLTDSFKDARSNGRVHDAIDIMAQGGTPVVAAVDGEIVKFFDSVAGGITIYQLDRDRRYIYYYAHLQRRAEGLSEGDAVKQGQTIAYVGDTGNAGPGNYHLHFSIARAGDPKRYWEGTYLNPYPFLMSGRVPE